ncbi:MAG TPA: glycosyltransferase [Steroidobacteraceae bacterium]|nr:glycosyltransferase [Steroidobacteraceae bacterium]
MGGAESVLLRLLESSPWRSDSVVISLGRDGVLAPKFRDLGVPVHELGMNAVLPNPFAVASVARILKAHGADVVSTWMYHADLVGGIAARLAGLPVIWGIRNSTLSRTDSAWTTRAIARLNGILSRWLPAVIVSCSERARDVHIELGYVRDKFTIIHNGIDIRRFQPDAHARAAVRGELNLSGENRLIGLIARFDPQKNHRGFIAAVRNLLERWPQLHVVMAGAGITSDNKVLCAWIAEAGIADRVHLLGARWDINRVMAALDCSVLPSFGEAFPSVLAESMACGVPCVTTDVGDAAAIVGTSGIVVPIGDMTALVKGIDELLEEDAETQRRRATLARARVAEMFDISTMAAAFEQLLRDTSAKYSRIRE